MLLASIALASVLPAASVSVTRREPGDIIQPEIVVPGEWLTDEAEHFLFLPLTVPEDIKLANCKVMSNGDNLLVVVTETPEEEPETNAVKKFRLIIEAMKQEAGHNEELLKTKLTTWLQTEDDDEVEVQIQAALDSLTTVRNAKANDTPRTVSVPLGLLAKQAASALGAPSAEMTTEEKEAERALPSLRRATQQRSGGSKNEQLRTSIIKESFSVEIPYPVPLEKIFILKTDSTTLTVAMPLERNSLQANGISTGGKAFLRVPVFSVQGEKLIGPETEFGKVADGLHVPSLTAGKGLKPLVFHK
jgi:hypothetical protein